ncbi:hypothetical protein PIROE2DRAFT_5602 [Piromyces sp. E2]|nr:hypothetical protein PIROE2DRAFT_5602 [Piromyces sp. E2]|eukprot:OUM66999.1 hypothetical protein PIROE2DRAFT_5602 [Piromyces sp. E2]
MHKGTPIQNNIGELHSLLQFQNPKIFNMKEKVFSAFFPSLSDTVELQSIIKPEKDKVLKLPPINEVVIYTGKYNITSIN